MLNASQVDNKSPHHDQEGGPNDANGDRHEGIQLEGFRRRHWPWSYSLPNGDDVCLVA